MRKKVKSFGVWKLEPLNFNYLQWILNAYE